MSVREEEERNKNCPSRGLGLAAAAIGVGVGAALYYFFSKRPENPADGGSTSSGWEEQPHVLNESYSSHNSSYTTISEHSTTDTSIHSSPEPRFVRRSVVRRLYHSESDTDEFDDFDSTEQLDFSTEQLDSSTEQFDFSTEHSGYSEHIQLYESNEMSIGSDSDTNLEWDVTNSSMDVPRDEQTPFMMQFGELTVRLLNPNGGWKSPWKVFPKYFRSAKEELDKRREQAFREREWTLEECSICFEGMQKEQEIFSLACTHRFHQSCIMPWLEQQQTCPNCRKAS